LKTTRLSAVRIAGIPVDIRPAIPQRSHHRNTWKRSLTYVPFYSKSDSVVYGYNLGQKAFTPENKEASEVVVDDRPYAGWAFVETFIGNRYSDQGDREKFNGLVLTVGIVGPAAQAEKVQKGLHKITDSSDVKGRDNQLENELGLNATFLQKWRRIYNIDKHRQSEPSFHSGLALGNIYSYASAGVIIRWGTHLKDDIGSPSISPGLPGLPWFNPNRNGSWYLYAGLEARSVAHNIFLDGNTNVDSHSVDKESLVGDLQIGVAIRRPDYRVSFSQTFRSKEFKGQPESSRFGSINFTLFVE